MHLSGISYPLLLLHSAHIYGVPQRNVYWKHRFSFPLFSWHTQTVHFKLGLKFTWSIFLSNFLLKNYVSFTFFFNINIELTEVQEISLKCHRWISNHLSSRWQFFCNTQNRATLIFTNCFTLHLFPLFQSFLYFYHFELAKGLFPLRIASFMIYIAQASHLSRGLRVPFFEHKVLTLSSSMATLTQDLSKVSNDDTVKYKSFSELIDFQHVRIHLSKSVKMLYPYGKQQNCAVTKTLQKISSEYFYQKDLM